MNQNQILQLLSLAQKAGKVVSGQFAVENSVKSMKAKLVIVAEDASANTKKEFMDMCHYYRTKQLVFGTKESLGRAIGKEYRACLALVDEGFANSLEKKLEMASQSDKEN